ncbi:hypothetical protein F2Q68_00006342 [Brassica cretica]|uniref:NADH:quinone oxidoreductase/Mrp antiporter transmembrane domain-containing protein n=1 Tax=Brassica cretica TaxID=69181 RepID=A0A8S9JHL4_BRACR|nr:hypothetical protein F2Q68_00006342 [Brassica cretica]
MGARSTIRFLSPVLLPCLAAVRLDLRICQLGFSWIRRFIPSLMCVVTSSIEVGEAASGKSLLSLVYEWNVIQKSLIYWRLCDLEAMVVYWWLFRILWSSCPTFVSSVDIGHTVPAEDQVGEPCDGKPSRTGHQRHKAGEYPAQCEASVGRSYAVSWFLTDGFSRFLEKSDLREDIVSQLVLAVSACAPVTVPFVCVLPPASSPLLRMEHNPVFITSTSPLSCGCSVGFKNLSAWVLFDKKVYTVSDVCCYFFHRVAYRALSVRSSCPTFVSSVDIGHTVPAEDQVGEPCDGKPSRTADKAATKAMLVNRVGDFGLAPGISGRFTLFQTVDFSTIFARASAPRNSWISCNMRFNAISLICILLLIGAVGKSAQIGSHTWSPDAMEVAYRALSVRSSCPTFVSSVDIGHTVPAEDQVGHQRHKAGEYPAQCEASVGRSYAVSWFLTDGFFRFLASQGVRYVFSWLPVLKLVLRWRWLVVPGLERVLELLSHLK